MFKNEENDMLKILALNINESIWWMYGANGDGRKGMGFLISWAGSFFHKIRASNYEVAPTSKVDNI